MNLQEAKEKYIDLAPFPGDKLWKEIVNKKELTVYGLPEPDTCMLCGNKKTDNDFWTNLWRKRTREVHDDFILIYDHDAVCERCNYMGELWDYSQTGNLRIRLINNVYFKKRDGITELEQKVLDDSNRIWKVGMTYFDTVWQKLQKAHEKSNKRYLNGIVAKYKIKTGTLAGRLGLTIGKVKSTAYSPEISFLGSDHQGDEYFTTSGYNGKANDIIVMLEKVKEDFNINKLKWE